MSTLYLQGVEFSNFRIYGDSYAFELPPGPSVTIITGGNGLGKTSFFDGIEWALTGQVSRFSDVHVDARRKTVGHLTRFGAPPDSHRVSLQFTDGLPIDRGQGFQTDEEGISRLLKQPHWADIKDLHGYLSITHFFGQTSAQRFSLKKPGEQWEALKGPAGVDRVNALHERLSGASTRKAFSRAIDDRSKALEEANASVHAWKALVAERDRAKQLAASGDAIQPADLTVEGNSLGERIAKVSSSHAWQPGHALEQPEALLDRLSALLRAVEGKTSSEQNSLATLATLAATFSTKRMEAQELRDQEESLKSQHESAAIETKKAEAHLQQAAKGLAESEAEALAAVNRVQSIDEVLRLIPQITDALTRQDAARIAADAATNAIALAEEKRRQLQDQRATADARLTERRVLIERIAQTRKLAQISASRAQIQLEIQRLRELTAALNLSKTRETKSELGAEAQKVRLRVGELTEALQSHDTRMAALAQAVSAIAHRLEHGDTACPVCATVFLPGELVELSRSQAGISGSSASTLAGELAQAQLELDGVVQRIAQADAALAEADKLDRALSTLRSRDADIGQQFVEAGGASDGQYDEVAISLLEHRLDQMEVGASALPTSEELGGLIEATNAELRAELAKRTALEQTVSEATRLMHEVRQRLFLHPDLWSPDKGLLVDLASERSTAEQRSRKAAEEVAKKRAAVAAARSSYVAVAETESRSLAAVNSLASRLTLVRQELQQLINSWTAAGMSGEPDGVRFAERKATVTSRIDALTVIRSEIERLISRYRKWTEDEQLRKLDMQISFTIEAEGVDTERDVDKALNDRSARALRELGLARAVKDKAEKIGSGMQEVSKTFAADVLTPLNSTIQHFARALMTWSDASINYRAEHTATRTELRPGILRSEADGSTTQVEVNPNLIFSEGQLSALSVAGLMAASTTFGWSRWRGLLLDDPLQHNDVIHASAFIDLLRQMVNRLGYQIILSTHDSAEAEFLIRKCRSAGISYRVHELIPGGDDGLVVADSGGSRLRPAIGS